MKNKRGWIEIVESFISVLLIAGILVIMVAGTRSQAPDNSLQIYDSEYAVLRYVQLNHSFRNDILGAPENLFPINWTNFNETNHLSDVKNIITALAPPYLDCEAALCAIDDACAPQSKSAKKNVYARSAIISANATDYKPRKLNLLCAEK